MSEFPPQPPKKETGPSFEDITKRVIEPLEALARLEKTVDAPRLFRAIDMDMLLANLDDIDAKARVRDRVYDWLQEAPLYGQQKGGGYMQQVAAKIVEHDFNKDGKILELSQTYGNRFLRADVLSRIPKEERRPMLRAYGKHTGIIHTMFAQEPEQFAAFMARYALEADTLSEPFEAWAERQPLSTLVSARILVERMKHEGDVSMVLEPLQKEAYKKGKEEFGVEEEVMNALSAVRPEAVRRAKASLETMYELERKVAGSVKRLSEEYGIREYSRYPQELLLAQLSEEGVPQPYGVAMFPRSDHNGAFDYAGQSLKKLFEQTRGHFGVKVIEVEDIPDAGRRLASLNARYGSEHKMSFAIIAGHGSPEAIQFGEGAGSQTWKRGNFLSRAHLKRDRIQRAREFFVEDPTIVLISCSTGASSGQEEGIAEMLAKTLKADVIAPKVDTNIKDLSVSYSDDGKPAFEVTFFAAPENHARFVGR